MKRAVVLGGGGVVGVAWLTAIVGTLLENGIDLREADLVVGTSAGSMVGTRIAAGQDVREPTARPLVVPMPDEGPDMAVLGQIFGHWSAMETVTAADCAKIGGWALGARTAPEADWIAATGGALGVDDWPATGLRISTVDAETGERFLWGASDGVSVQRAVAGSCSVPGLFPPVELAGRPHVDGGVWSGTHADAAAAIAPGIVVVIAPITEGTAAFGALADRALAEEVRVCEKAGAKVIVVQPLAAEQEAFGPDLMSGAAAPNAAAAGVDRARALAANELAEWNA